MQRSYLEGTWQARKIPDPHLVESQLTADQIIDEKFLRVIAYVRQP